MKKVLVTGATGFIGLHCIHQLLEQGYAVRGTLRSQSRAQEVATASRQQVLILPIWNWLRPIPERRRMGRCRYRHGLHPACGFALYCRRAET